MRRHTDIERHLPPAAVDQTTGHCLACVILHPTQLLLHINHDISSRHPGYQSVLLLAPFKVSIHPAANASPRGHDVDIAPFHLLFLPAPSDNCRWACRHMGQHLNCIVTSRAPYSLTRVITVLDVWRPRPRPHSWSSLPLHQPVAVTIPGLAAPLAQARTC